MAAINLAINLVVLGLSGVLSIPAFASFGKTPEANVVTVNIGVGATNTSVSFPDKSIKTPGGVVPIVELWDVLGNQMGTASSKDPVVEGGSLSLTMSGKNGGKTSTTPMYIRLIAQDAGEVCIVEGIYCDMCHRRAYPLCGEKESRSCFDMDLKQIRASGNERRDGNIPQKSYEEVRHWK
ncbi:hypothetical protein HYALB_00009344 [Hymenoscyphus albidus]|uniref:Uncharacterized protein n=1 Tax=Hymenoscyphus albidus TaxID=595503 RepID=A0A9N9PW82_9HELO|nr:hypothetical protein HYALB_00009344 [Hymenoscyphus albidus]